MLLTHIALVLGASVANACSQLLLKQSARVASAHADMAGKTAALLLSWQFWAACLTFAISLAIYLYLVSIYDVLVAFPAMAATHVFVMLLAAFVLKEPVSLWRIGGSTAIVFGLVVMTLGAVET